MSKYRVITHEYVRSDKDKKGLEIPVYRRHVQYKTKADLKAEREAAQAEGKRRYEEALAAHKAKLAKQGEENVAESKVEANG